LPVELALLQAQLQDVEMRLGRLAERIGGGGGGGGGVSGGAGAAGAESE
jgi:hypothetical protein